MDGKIERSYMIRNRLWWITAREPPVRVGKIGYEVLLAHRIRRKEQRSDVA